MASVFKRPNGRFWIQFLDRDQKHKTIRLGGVKSKAIATTIKVRIEYLIQAKFLNVPIDPETAKWLSEVDYVLYDRIAKTGLATPRSQVVATTLKPFLDGYIDGRTDVKPRTRTNLRQCAGFLVEHFGAEKPIDKITAGDAEDFIRWLATQVGDNTKRRHAGRAMQMFRYAVQKKLISVSPFAETKDYSVQANKKRDRFIDRETAEKVLAACTNDTWRTIFVLCRFGGLRCPSEVSILRWSDVDWKRSRITVRSPKTEAHAGKDERTIPLFPELRAVLEPAYASPDRDETIVIGRAITGESNLRTGLTKIIKRAGLAPWPKLFQNLRQTRETELASSHPIHVVAEWMGHDQLIAQKHYLRVTEADFERASGEPGKEEAKQKAKHQRRLTTKNSDKQRTTEPHKTAKNTTLRAKTDASEYPRRDSNLRPAL